MDKKTEQLLLEAEGLALIAEKIKPVKNDATLMTSIASAYTTSRMIDVLTKARTAKNASYQKKVKEHSSWFKPMIDRLEKAKVKLRDEVNRTLNPTGDLGNMSVEEVRAYGTDGVGTASYAEITEYDFDLVVIAELCPHLLKVDEKAVAKLIKEGNLPQGVTPKTGYQLRIA